MTAQFYLGEGLTCKFLVALNGDGNGVLIPNVMFEDRSLDSEQQGRYLLPIRIGEGTLSEVPWTGIKRHLFGKTISAFKRDLKELLRNGDPLEKVELELTKVRTLVISSEIELDKSKFRDIFFSDPTHISEATMYYAATDESRPRRFETCRGAMDLGRLLRANGLGVEIKVFDIDF